MRPRLRSSRRSHAALLLALIVPIGADAQARVQRIFAGAPEANWIAPPGLHPDSFAVFHARRTFELAARPARFLVHVSADNRYRLYVNGTQVSSGPQRSDAMHWRYETVDLAPMLRAGTNVIAALVWNWGANHPVAQHSLRTAFLLQGDGPAEAVANTGAGWKLLRDSAYTDVRVTPADVGNAYYAAAHGESVDGARYPWGWERQGYDDRAWYTVETARSPAIVGNVLLHAVPGRGGYGDASGWQLEPRDLPPMEETPVRFTAVRRANGVPLTDGFIRGGDALVVPPNTRASLVLDHGRTTNAYTVLETSGGTGSTITLTYAEAAVDSAGRKGHRNEVEGRRIRGIRDVVRPGGGDRRRFQSLYWRSGRYVDLDVQTGAEPLRIHDASAIFTAYPFVERARFASDLPWLADMWRMNWNGARIGAFETYMDTPYYEQLQYIGDTRLQALISLYVSGDDRLMRQAIVHFDDSRLPEGITTSRYPSELQQLIPTFALIHVAMVHDYHLHRHDPPFVRARLAGIRGILDWYGRRVDSTGMLGPMPYWNFVDWAERWGRGVPAGADDGHSATISLLYAYALDHAAPLEAELGVAGMAQAYRARADSLRRAVRARAWDAPRRLFRDAPDSAAFSQQTNVLAILTDAIPASEQRALMERVLADTSLVPASYYFAWYVHEALRKVGLADRYIEVLAPWRTMLALGLTSAPEKEEPTRSDSHAWAAHPNYGLLATVLGVRPASPGFRVVGIAPALGPLRTASGRVPHPRGDIDVSLTRVGAAGLSAEVTLPAGVSGRFEWNGRTVPLRAGRQTVRF
ncbi:MAG TPA: alpha-L-rhamnosidase C-terminal domain-containing protein [Gemmatimonadaceae bacterium]|nr:alpha-L-rhamnosidase C-terminal domain-containing protein [Gemmatimonadaceae bacterium]